MANLRDPDVISLITWERNTPRWRLEAIVNLHEEILSHAVVSHELIYLEDDALEERTAGVACGGVEDETSWKELLFGGEFTP